MKDLIKENYESIVGRGLITHETGHGDFIMKLQEEVEEYIEAVNLGLPNENEELADIVLVCLNIAYHYSIDIENELKNKIKKNKQR